MTVWSWFLFQTSFVSSVGNFHGVNNFDKFSTCVLLSRGSELAILSVISPRRFISSETTVSVVRSCVRKGHRYPLRRSCCCRLSRPLSLHRLRELFFPWMGSTKYLVPFGLITPNFETFSSSILVTAYKRKNYWKIVSLFTFFAFCFLRSKFTWLYLILQLFLKPDHI